MSLKQMAMFAKQVSETKNVDSIRMINAVSFPHLNKKAQKALMKRLNGEPDQNMIQL